MKCWRFDGFRNFTPIQLYPRQYKTWQERDTLHKTGLFETTYRPLKLCQYHSLWVTKPVFCPFLNHWIYFSMVVRVFSGSFPGHAQRTFGNLVIFVLIRGGYSFNIHSTDLYQKAALLRSPFVGWFYKVYELILFNMQLSLFRLFPGFNRTLISPLSFVPKLMQSCISLV